MCGFNRDDFSLCGKIFGHHQINEHNPWSYLFYMYYLKNKNRDDLSFAEVKCLEKIELKHTGWFPIGNTAYLDSKKKEHGYKILVDQMNMRKENLKVNNQELSKIGKSDEGILAHIQNLESELNYKIHILDEKKILKERLIS